MNVRRLVGIGLLASCMVLPAVADTQNGYSHDSNVKTANADWMSALPDSTRLSRISMPGTHDTMAFYGGDSAQTQSMSLGNQLTSGIRALDIRCVIHAGGFEIYHGPVYQFSTFGDVLFAVTNFLADHPGETVLMRIKKEHSADDDAAFESIFTQYRDRNSSYFWSPSPPTLYGPPEAYNPTLGSVRGKIIVLQDFKTTRGITSYGISWTSMKTQDNYNLSSNWDLYSKWEAVRDQFIAANNQNPDNQLWSNFLSGSGGSFPYFVASGKSSPQTGAPLLATGLTTPAFKSSYPDFPRVSCFIGICTIAFLGTNQLSTNWLGAASRRHVGIIYSDFPGPDLIKNVIKSN